MIQMLRKRLNRKEDGFTLIELMVVILIIAILLAIAIPTFLGARGRAQNRAAEANLRNALTASKTGYTDSQSYYGTASLASLSSIEPSLSWVSSAPAKGTNAIGVNTYDSGNALCLWAQSSSGNYYGIFDVATSDTTYSTVGTIYFEGSSAPGCSSGATFTYPTLGSGGWANTPSGAGW